MAEKDKEKAEKSSEKLMLFNHSRNPFNLGKNEDGTVRWFLVGHSMECKDKAEYDLLRNYKGVSTTKQVSPGLDAHVQSLRSEINEKNALIEEQRKRLEKFESKGK